MKDKINQKTENSDTNSHCRFWTKIPRIHSGEKIVSPTNGGGINGHAGE